MEKFCSELTTGGLEGLCDCVSEDVYQFYGTKAQPCNRDPQTHSQKYLYASRATKREKQEYETFHCRCPVSSTYTLEWKKILILNFSITLTDHNYGSSSPVFEMLYR